MRETRTGFIALLGYSDVFDQEEYSTALDLIRGIPSIELLTNIAWINFNLFLNDGRENIYAAQILILNEVLKHLTEEEKQILNDPIENYKQQNNLAVYFTRQGNLKMYDLIFRSWNHNSARQLSPDERMRFLKAYLIINTEIGAKIKIDNEAFEDAKDNEDAMTDLILAKFIHQTDYKRNYDYSTQTVRGSLFFEYLTNSNTFKEHLRKFLNWHRATDANEYLYNIIVLITKAIPGSQYLQASHIVNMNIVGDAINHRLLSRISINEKFIGYIASDDFTTIRKFPIYKGSNKQYLILDMPFLYDKLFKNVVFTFKDHLKENNFTENFLSIKGKEFTEEILFYNLISRCFNGNKYQLYSGKMTEPICKGELCDYYIRSNDRVALIELKDVLLDSISKNDGTKKVLFEKMDLKFSSNQNKSPKGVKQLAKAIEKLSNGISFDAIDSDNIKIYPIICYTDSSFGFDGINRRYDKMFQEALTSISVSKKFVINPLVFINLDFFQHFEDFLNNESIDFFGLIDGYYKHLKIPEHEIVPFEVYVGSYINDMGKHSEISKLGKERLFEIMKSRT